MSSPELSIDPVASSTKEPLTNLSQSDYRRLTTPISEFSFTGKPLSKFEWRGGYIYYRYQGPATLDQSYSGTAPNSTGALAPYTVSQTARDTVTEPDHILYQSFTYKPKDWWEIIVDYRYSRFTTNTFGNFGSVLGIVTNPTSATPVTSTTPASGTDSFVWRDGLSDFDFSMLFTPTHSLTLRPAFACSRPMWSRSKTAWPIRPLACEPRPPGPNSVLAISLRRSSVSGATSMPLTTAHPTRRSRPTPKWPGT